METTEPGPAETRKAAQRAARHAAEQAAIAEWARKLVDAAPPLSDWQRERLRVLFDLSGDYDDD